MEHRLASCPSKEVALTARTVLARRFEELRILQQMLITLSSNVRIRAVFDHRAVPPYERLSVNEILGVGVNDTYLHSTSNISLSRVSKAVYPPSSKNPSVQLAVSFRNKSLSFLTASTPNCKLDVPMNKFT